MRLFSKKHPMALPYLFFSEMWERFGYYLMIGIFTLYLKDVADGFAMTEAESADLYGTFIGLVFLTPFIGGLLADRYLGLSRSIIIGGIMMALGYFLIGIHIKWVLYLAMTLVILGNGLFKPNISTLLGNIYNVDQYRAHKDEGYNIFYMGINIGAFICNFFGAALQIMLGWKYAFMAAGVGMIIGVIVFLIGKRHYISYDVIKPAGPNDMPLSKIIYLILMPAFVFAIIGWILPSNIFGSDSTDAFIFACIPVVYFYIDIYFKAQREEKKPILALLAIFAVVILFWAVFKQNGSALNTWADRYTDREVHGLTAEWCKDLKQAKDIAYKMDSVPLYDAAFRLQKQEGTVLKEYNYPVYFRNQEAQKLPADGDKITVWATNLSQSINPFWVIALTPLVVAFFNFLNRKKREPSTPTKIALGLLISALSVLVMVLAVKYGKNGAEKVSVAWLIASYGVITLGELMLSPMGLSVVSKLSPPRITAIMMGGWFLSTSIGNRLSGVLASLWDQYDNKANFFWVNFGLLIFASLLMLLILKWLNEIFKTHTLK